MMPLGRGPGRVQPRADRGPDEEEAGKEGRQRGLWGRARDPNTNKQWTLLLFCLRLCCRDVGM